jgi:hypothetical protein
MIALFGNIAIIDSILEAGILESLSPQIHRCDLLSLMRQFLADRHASLLPNMAIS